MINLEIEKYCNNCSEFEPAVIKEKERDFYGNCICDTVVKCKHSDRCIALMEYLKR